MATIKDVADNAGVSIATVSKVINNKGSISRETQLKVLESVKEIGYQKNMAATSIRTKRSMTTGLIIPSITNPFFPVLAQNVEEEFVNNDYTMFLCNTNRDENTEIKYLQRLVERQVDGIIIFSPSSKASEWIKEHNHNDILFIAIEQPIIDSDYETIYIDNKIGIRKAVEHIISLNHKRIGYITGPLKRKCNQERLDAFKEALNAADISVVDDFIKEGHFTFESGYNISWQLLNHPERPSAIFTGNDIMAFGCIKSAIELGIKVPEELSVIGYDDIPQAAYFIPSLTTISQPAEKIGKEAARYILDKLANKDMDFDNNLATSLVIRRSTHYKV